MKPLSKFVLTFVVAAGLTTAGQAQISFTGTPYLQDANSYVGTAVSVPAGWAYTFSGTPTFQGVGR